MQDRLSYANGNTITTEGFRCSVGEPIDIKATVGADKEVDLQGESGKIIPYGDYLITLEVNGEKAAYRDLYHLGDPVTVVDYTISDDMYLDGVSEGDEVVMRLEPVELMVTDTFRAAVKSLGGAASESSGGGSGGGVLVVHNANGTLDKTWAEIDAADVAVIVSNGGAGGVTLHMREVVMSTVGMDGTYSVDATGMDRVTYETDSADGYPVTVQEGKS